MKHNFEALFVSTLFLFLINITAFGQTPETLNGKVVDSNGDAVSGASIVLSGRSVRMRLDTITDQAGAFSLRNVPSGDYLLEVTAGSFAGQIVEVKLPGQDEFVVTLEARAIAAEVSVMSGLLAGTGESLSDVPGSIERIDAQTLESSRVFNFSEALRKLAGVNVRDEEGFGLRPNIGIRGTNPSRSTKILLLEDGLPLTYAPYGDNSSYYHPPVERYESIEVLKGSGQIVYGPQTIAGVVNYITPNPPQKPTFDIKLEGGNQRFFNGAAGGGATYG